MHNKVFGLIGNPIKHSFSKIYFEEKFRRLGITDCEYKLFELKSINELPQLLESEPNLQGFNVTSPYKTSLEKYLISSTITTQFIGAVNTVRINDGKLFGYNTDWIGFLNSLKSQIDITKIHSALVLGTGGAASAVKYALGTQQINCKSATTKDISWTRLPLLPYGEDVISYKDLNKLDNLDMFDLIVNATPCGMEHIEPLKEFPYQNITSKHIVFDLIYNPEETYLLSRARKNGAKTINGLGMLYLQADESWKIWTGTGKLL
ncbi:MAG: shikimate dehydrogenase [Bacteroidales bacterium]|nr:shikimate dehydrogenase [Bacteroidales bacterium]